jgi:polyisoprenoid-binding protein YceI
MENVNMARRFAAHLALGAAALALLAAPAALAAPSTDAAKLPAGEWKLEKTHASVVGTVSHAGFSHYTFRFDKIDASFNYDPAKPEAAQLKVTVDANSMNTGFAKADQQFPAEFLMADKHPTVTFVSKSITRTGDKGKVAGDLTLAGVTKPVTLDVTFNGYEKDFTKTDRAGFSATTTIDRTQFGSTKYSPMIGNDVKLAIEVEFTK